MLILKILLILVAVIILFVLFLRHKLEFTFETPNFWEFYYSNIFFKKKFGTDNPLSSEKSEDNDSTLFEESEAEVINSAKKLEIKEEYKEKAYKKLKGFTERKKSDEKQKKKEEKAEKNEKDDEIYENSNKNPEKSLNDWLEYAKKLWRREKKFVKSMFKYLIFLLKISLNLLKPSKINLSAEGGFENPAETGWFYSAFILLNSYFEENKRIRINFTPQFFDCKWKAQGQIVYSFSLAGFFFLALLAFIRFPYLQTIKFLWRNRKHLKRKKNIDLI